MNHVKTLLAFLSLFVLVSCRTSEKEHQNKNLSTTIRFYKSKVIFLLKDFAVVADRYSVYPKQKESDTLRIPYYYQLPDGADTSQLSFLLTVPAGDQYEIMYPDHSQCRFNSGTTLSFTLRVDSVVRIQPQHLYLGELFIRLAKRDSLNMITDNFLVHADAGSSLNLINYPDEPFTVASFIEGQGKVSYKGATTSVVQGQEAIVDKNKRSITLKNGDPVSNDWTMGWIRGENVADFLRKAGRWFDKEIVYNGVTNPEKFEAGISFRIENYTLENTFKVIEENFHIKCIEKDGKIWVSKS